MVAIAPFRALRYAADGDSLARLTTPPHDCIPDPQRATFEAEARNIIHAVLPRDRMGDGDGPGPPSKYARAAEALRQWQSSGDMVRDARPGLYFYQVSWRPDGGERVTMSGFFARLAVDPTGTQVHPHERTLQRPRQDRLLLRQATGADVEPIWLLYRDERGWVHELLESNAFDELARFTDEDGHEHRLWRVDRYEAVAEIVAQFDDRELVIADGHHRYRTALEQYAASGRPEHGSILVCLVRDNDPGLRVEATHRLVHGLPFADLDEALRLAQPQWTSKELPIRGSHAEAARSLVAALQGDGRRCVLVGNRQEKLQAFLLTLREGHAASRLDSLAVTRVHDRLLAPWGVATNRPEAHVRYARDASSALDAVAAGQCQFAVLLPPEPVAAVLDVAREGQLMPQKATYFVPKLRSGVVLSPLDEPMPRPWTDLAGDGGKPDFRLPPLG